MFKGVPYLKETDHIAVVTRVEAGNRFPVTVGFGDSTPRLLNFPDVRLFRLSKNSSMKTF